MDLLPHITITFMLIKGWAFIDMTMTKILKWQSSTEKKEKTN